MKSASTYTTTTTSGLHDEVAVADPGANATEDIYDIFGIPRPSEHTAPTALVADEDLIDLRSARSREMTLHRLIDKVTRLVILI
jgi:hypothetical protein